MLSWLFYYLFLHQCFLRSIQALYASFSCQYLADTLGFLLFEISEFHTLIKSKDLCGGVWCYRTDTVHWGRAHGKAKVGGVITCILGALFMALYKGPALLGDGFSDLHLQGMAMEGKPAPEPVGWLATTLIDLGMDMWHIGVICLIGNCFCMAVYIAFQVLHPCIDNIPAYFWRP